MIAELNELIVKKISDLIFRAFDYKYEEINISFPPDFKLGDFTVSCFDLAKELKQSPIEIAAKIGNVFVADEVFEAISVVGPYLNIKIRAKELFSRVVSDVINDANNFGNSNINQGQKIMVEYLSPNTNKPLHLGHVRNGALGMSVAKILQSTGAETIKANLVNDRGIHICKSMLAWKKWGEGATPESWQMKGDHFVGHWYVKFAQEAAINPGLEDEAQAMLQDWENGDEEVLALWRMMNSWVLGGFEETFKKLNFQFDKTYFESNTYKLGKELVNLGLAEKVFQKDENGAVIAYLPEADFGVEKDGSRKKVTLIRKDGTSVYITQDLETARLKFEENGLTESIYVVGSEQDYHFKVLFKLLEMLNFPWAKQCFHLSYGMVYLPEGKMKSREGKVVDADDLVMGMQTLAKEEIIKRDPDKLLSEEELNFRASVVGDAAIKYFLLQFAPKQDIHFDPKASLSFEGNTGPYCQYTYARAKSILAKSGTYNNEVEADFSLLTEIEERILANKLIDFPAQVEKAAKELNPSKIVFATYDLAKAFNQFYQKHQVLNMENKSLRQARLLLVKAAAIGIQRGLSLLNINVLEQM